MQWADACWAEVVANAVCLLWNFFHLSEPLGQNQLLFSCFNIASSSPGARVCPAELPTMWSCTRLECDKEGSWACLPPASPEPQKAGLQMGEQSSGQCAWPKVALQHLWAQRPQNKGTGPLPKAKSPWAGPRGLSHSHFLPCKPTANSLPNLINDFLLLLNFISKPGQLLLVSFPVALHLLLQRLLQARPGEMCHPLIGAQPTPRQALDPNLPPSMSGPKTKEVSGPQHLALLYWDSTAPKICNKTEWALEVNQSTGWTENFPWPSVAYLVRSVRAQPLTTWVTPDKACYLCEWRALSHLGSGGSHPTTTTTTAILWQCSQDTYSLKNTGNERGSSRQGQMVFCRLAWATLLTVAFCSTSLIVWSELVKILSPLTLQKPDFSVIFLIFSFPD